MLNHAISLEFKQEAASTKRMLEKVPADKFDWKPHERSMSLKEIATHVANIPAWITLALSSDEYDFASRGYKEDKPESKEDLIAIFAGKVEQALQALQSASDETLGGNWTLRSGQRVFFTLPRTAAIRTLAMNHLIHHRGQLSVYLRLLDVPVPGMYGPSADEM